MWLPKAGLDCLYKALVDSSVTLCYFALVFFSPFSIAITLLGEERADLSVFRTFVRFAHVWFCLFPLPLGVWKELWFVIVALPRDFPVTFFEDSSCVYMQM